MDSQHHRHGEFRIFYLNKQTNKHCINVWQLDKFRDINSVTLIQWIIAQCLRFWKAETKQQPQQRSDKLSSWEKKNERSLLIKSKCVWHSAAKMLRRVLYLVCEMDLFSIASHRNAIALCQVDCLSFFLSSSVYGMPSSTVIVTSFRIVFFILLEIKHNIYKIRCVIKQPSSAKQNWKTSYCRVRFPLFLSFSMLFERAHDYRNSNEHWYDNMNDIHSNQLLGYIPLLPRRPLKQ